MKVRLLLQGSTSENNRTTLMTSASGTPIVPSIGHDIVLGDKHAYVVEQVVWLYDREEPEVLVYARRRGAVPS